MSSSLSTRTDVACPCATSKQPAANRCWYMKPRCTASIRESCLGSSTVIGSSRFMCAFSFVRNGQAYRLEEASIPAARQSAFPNRSRVAWVHLANRSPNWLISRNASIRGFLVATGNLLSTTCLTTSKPNCCLNSSSLSSSFRSASA